MRIFFKLTRTKTAFSITVCPHFTLQLLVIHIPHFLSAISFPMQNMRQEMCECAMLQLLSQLYNQQLPKLLFKLNKNKTQIFNDDIKFVLKRDFFYKILSSDDYQI